jgi:RNA polymerase sigma-70 factor (ECF subfamily)
MRAESNDFEKRVLCHLDAAYNLARWLLGSDADDAVQEACLRAHRAFDQFRGGDARAWLLSIVRNSCLTTLSRRKTERLRLVGLDNVDPPTDAAAGPAERLVQSSDEQRLRQAIASLDVEFREIIILREMDGMSYKEVATVTGVPIGTVMSRLSRARQRLHEVLCEEKQTLP